jgi:hypothetical protein
MEVTDEQAIVRLASDIHSLAVSHVVQNLISMQKPVPVIMIMCNAMT